MNIVFKKLKIRNFLSIGSIDLNFTNQNNIVFMTGSIVTGKQIGRAHV